MFCPKCGAEIEDGASFCTSCGNPVDSAGRNAEQGQAYDGYTPTVSQTYDDDAQWQPFDDNTPMVSQIDGLGSQKQSGKKKFPIIAVIAVVFIAVLVVAGVFVLSKMRSDDETVSADATEEAGDISDDEESGAEEDADTEEESEPSDEPIGGSYEAADETAKNDAAGEEPKAEEEPKVEEKTVDLDAVMNAYESYIQYTYSKGHSGYPVDSFYLVCLNDDDIPELLMTGQSGYLKSLSILSYSADTGEVFIQFVFEDSDDKLTLRYDERENHFAIYYYEGSYSGDTLIKETESWNLYQIESTGSIGSLGEVERFETSSSVVFSIPDRDNTTAEIYNDYVGKNCIFRSELTGDYLDMYRSVEEAYAAYLGN